MGIIYRGLIKKLVIINTLDEQTFRGILFKQTGSLIILKQAQLLEPNNPPVEIAGEVVLERRNISFIQVLTEGVR